MVPFLAKVRSVLFKHFWGHLSKTQSLLHRRHISVPSFTKMLWRVFFNTARMHSEAEANVYEKSPNLCITQGFQRAVSSERELPVLTDHEKSDAKICNHIRYQSTTWLWIFESKQRIEASSHHHRNYWEHKANSEVSKVASCFLRGEQWSNDLRYQGLIMTCFQDQRLGQICNFNNFIGNK